MPKKDLLILGAGGYGRCIAEVAEQQDHWANIVFVDDCWADNKQIEHYRIISDIQHLKILEYSQFEAIVAVGNNKIRQKWQQLLIDLGIPLTTIIHPHAVISPSAKIGRGVSIMAGCIVGTKTVIHDGVILNIGTLLDHDVIIEDFCHLSVGVKVAGGKRISQQTFLEVGTIISH
jgi:sugar O-acyltransferase (sialic acid O-acetyltransferase NeuD family)